MENQLPSTSWLEWAEKQTGLTYNNSTQSPRSGNDMSSRTRPASSRERILDHRDSVEYRRSRDRSQTSFYDSTAHGRERRSEAKGTANSASPDSLGVFGKMRSSLNDIVAED